MRIIRSLSAIFLIASSIVLTSALPVTAQQTNQCPEGQYPPAERNLSVSKNQVQRGETITVSGSGFLPGSKVTISIMRGEAEPTRRVLAEFTVGPDGTFSGPVTIPRDLQPGNWTMEATGTGCDVSVRVLEARIRVLGEQIERQGEGRRAGEGRIAITGWEVLPMILAAAGVLLVGGGLLMMSRRRSKHKDTLGTS